MVVTQVTPSSVAIRFEPSATRIVPVQPSVEGEPAPGFIVGKIAADPPTVEVVGPESVLRRVTEAITEPLWVGSAQRRCAVSSVIVGVADEGVRLKSAETALVSVAIVPAPAARQLPGRAGAATQSRGGLSATVTPPSVKVRVRGTKEAIAKIRDTSIVAYVDLEGIGEATTGCRCGSSRRPMSASINSIPRLSAFTSNDITPRLFGTDGIRGTAGTFPLDVETVRRVGAALVKALPHRMRSC